MTTSQGTFNAMPYFYNMDDFKSLVDNALGMPMQMTYQSDGSFVLNYNLNYSFCLQPDPEAASSGGTDTPGIKLPPGFTEFSPFMLRYTDGFSQYFRPAFAHADEVMASLGKLPGMLNSQMAPDGSVSVTWIDGQITYKANLMPSMLLYNPSGQTNPTPGFVQDQDGTWWYIFSNGMKQRFQVQLMQNQQ